MAHLREENLTNEKREMNAYSIKTLTDQFTVTGDGISLNETMFLLYITMGEAIVAIVNMSQLVSVVMSPLAN